MAYLNPKFIVVDFLRNLLTDPNSNRTTQSNSTTSTASAGQTEFTYSPSSGYSVAAISSVTVDASDQDKWVDYYIDFKNRTVIFFTARAGGEEVIITFNETTANWIFWDEPDEGLSSSSFPRISIKMVSGPGLRLGNFKAPVEHSLTFQASIWCKDAQTNEIFTISGDEYAGADLGEYIGYKITEAFEDNEDDLHPALYDYTPQGAPIRRPFNERYQSHHVVVDFILKGQDIGRIS